MRRPLLLALGLCACSDPPEDTNLCDVVRSESAGTVEVGVTLTGNQFASIAEREDVYVELGLQGLYMFVANVRVHDMRIGEGKLGAIEVNAFAETAETELSLAVGCREREFTDGAEGAQLASPFWVALRPEIYDVLDGLVVRLRATVRDLDGLEAIDERTVVARLPQQ